MLPFDLLVMPSLYPRSTKKQGCAWLKICLMHPALIRGSTGMDRAEICSGGTELGQDKKSLPSAWHPPTI